MYLIIIYISFISFLISILYGRYMGAKGTIYFVISCMIACNLISIFLFYEVGWLHTTCYIDLVNWINLDFLNIKYSFLFDSLTVAMLFVITTISLFAHIYSIDYMHAEAHVVRFLAYLSLFTFSMIVLVTANNLLQLFVGWEAVGLCSYLLINFWFIRVQANKAALKALFVNKISDLCLIFSISLTILFCHSVDYSVFCASMMKYSIVQIPFFDEYFISVSSMICLLLLIGAMGKSAQFGLHVWLPDAMEGPTPVSSLIHAATMVTAGIFLIIRISYLFEFTNNILLLIVFVGAITIFFSSTVGLVQNDIKKVVAYSTCGQIAYMLFVCGYSGYTAAMFHLFNHAFFKALLFLTAGSIIHALSNEQDVRRMGGLLKVVPFSYISFFVGSISLMGLPFLTGYYSKDFIMELAYNFVREFFIIEEHSIFVVRSFYLVALISITLTAIYSIRIMCLSFLTEYSGFKSFVNSITDSSFRMNIILLFLVIFSIFIGLVFSDMFVGVGTDFWSNAVFAYFPFDYEFVNSYVKLLPIIYSLYGMFLCLLLYKLRVLYEFLYNLQVYPYIYSVYYFFSKRWLIDKIYNDYLVGYTINVISYDIFFTLFDKGLLDFLGPTGITKVIQTNTSLLSRLQTGLLYHYVGILLNVLLVSLLLGVIDMEVLYYIVYIYTHVGIIY